MHKCFTCGHPLVWQSSEALSELEMYEELSPDSSACAHFFTCPNCGSTIEHYECPDDEMDEYPYWKDEE